MSISFKDQIGHQKLTLTTIPDPKGDIWGYDAEAQRGVLKTEFLYREFERIELERREATPPHTTFDMFENEVFVEGEPERWRANIYARNGRFMKGRWRSKMDAAKEDALAMNTSVNVARALGCD